MELLVAYALPATVVVAALGAIVMCAAVVRYGFGVEEDEEPEDRARRHLVTGLAHAVAAACFAVVVILAVLASAKRPAPPTPVAADLHREVETAREEIRELRRQAREALATVTSGSVPTPAAPGAAPERTTPPTRPPEVREPTSEPRTGASVPDREVSRERAVAPRPAPATPELSLPERQAPSPATRRETPGGESRKPAPSPPAERPRAARPPDESQSALARATVGRRVTTVVEGIRVDLQSRPGAGDETYVVRLSEREGQPVSDAEVTLQGRMPDGTTMRAVLEATGQPGEYRARVVDAEQGARDLRLRVARRDRRFEVAVGER